MGQIRTFIAVDVSAEVRARANDLANRLRVSDVKANWTKPENMHLTLKFLGDTDETLIPDVCRRVAQAAKPFTPFRLVFGEAGAFPKIDRPRTVWLGVTEGDEPIVELQSAIEDTLADLRFPREHRRFKPHLTIGRVRGGGPKQEELGRLIAGNAEFDAHSCQVSELLIFASYLEPAGPTYQILGRAPLEG
jgi:2'-5' RNA ligase